MYDGTVVHGTKEAIMEEASRTWATMRDPRKQDEMRGNMKRLSEILHKSRAPGGMSHAALESFRAYLK